MTSPTKRTPTERTPTKRTPTERTPTKRTPRTPTKRTSTERTPTERTPTERTPTERTPTRAFGDMDRRVTVWKRTLAAERELLRTLQEDTSFDADDSAIMQARVEAQAQALARYEQALTLKRQIYETQVLELERLCAKRSKVLARNAAVLGGCPEVLRALVYKQAILLQTLAEVKQRIVADFFLAA